LSFFNELKRRNVIRVAIAYVVMAWLVMQVADVILNNIDAPSWVFQTILLLLGIGFLVAMFFSWAFEMTPEGLKREHEVDRSQSITPQTGKKLNNLIFTVMALAIAYFAYDKFVLDASRDAALVEAATQAGVEQATSEEVSVETDNSIAVLPFVNMSSDEEQEYFSDGLSEELLNLLAKIPELRVAARTSSFSLKGKEMQIAEVGETLKVAHVLEGSVRKAGNQVRITAQLIHAEDGYHLWSETYDRSLDNIFAIQDEIAAAVVAQLKVTLLGAAPTVHATDPQAYALYLQGRHLKQQRTASSYEQALTLLQQALAIDPDYAEAWVELGIIYDNQLNLGLRPIEEGLALQRDAINKALVIDPDNALALANHGYIAMVYDNDLTAAAMYFERALQLEPANTEIMRTAFHLYSVLGRIEEAPALTDYLIARDPVSSSGHAFQGLYFASTGRWNEAIVSYRTALALSPGSTNFKYTFGVAQLFMGDAQAALEEMQSIESVWGMIGLPMAYHALGRTEESDAALAMGA
jgi:TolB-like protein/Tfp pilus assembly protein PilF